MTEESRWTRRWTKPEIEELAISEARSLGCNCNLVVEVVELEPKTLDIRFKHEDQCPLMARKRLEKAREHPASLDQERFEAIIEGRAVPTEAEARHLHGFLEQEFGGH